MAKRRVYEAQVAREGNPGLVFMWFVDDNCKRVPVLPNPDGTVRLVLGDADQIALCDLLDGIMELRALGAWQAPNEHDAPSAERLVQPGRGKWGPANWSSIVFVAGVSRSARYCIRDIAQCRREAEERIKLVARPATAGCESREAGDGSAPRSCPHCGGALGVGQ